MRRLPLLLLLAGLQPAPAEPEPPEPEPATVAPSGAQCLEHDCFAVFWAPLPFAAASTACERHGGHLMTVRSTVAEEAIALLLQSRGGRLWLGLRLPTACTQPEQRLRGFQWVTGDSRTDYANWGPSGRRCGRRCATVSRELRWEERGCEEPADGFLCEYNYPDSCPRLPPADGLAVAYRTPFGARGGEFLALPPGSTALVPALGLELRCAPAAAGGGLRWGRSQHGAWACRLAGGGCEGSCAEPGGRPSCSCPAGKALGPDGRGCASPCAGAPCQHHCVPNEGSFLCMCEAGYRLAPDGSSCEDVDDCTESPGLCEQACLNTEGGFECRCHNGYEMMGEHCQPVSSCYAAPCEHRCEDVPGGYRCSCMPGYAVHPHEPSRCVLHCEHSQCPAECSSNSCYCPEGFLLEEASGNDTAMCVDINECEMGYCEHNCTNQPGSYTCHCLDGYVVVDRNHCQKTLLEDGSSGDFELWTPGPSRSPPKMEHLHPGALVGIAVGVLCAALVLLAVGYHLAKKRCRPPTSMDYKCGNPHEKEMGLQQVTAGCAASGQKL